ncbi:MAG: family 43 glycosylhydrolase [Lachnospiraceae bacterium]|nr:family 43 glycosylhydrolase [Lachnospiraceae bacterium]
MNPYLPCWEYIPDGEPHEYDGRVYVYGSHDKFKGSGYCLLDYVCYSAPADDLTDWRYEGVIYKKTDDPDNRDGRMCLYAPDVTKGPDGKYYLYYVLDLVPYISVARCDTPAGKYEFYGYVHYQDGTRAGERPGEEAMFDPAVITEGDTTYLYSGFCMPDNKERHGMMVLALDKDMLTVTLEPRHVVPSKPWSGGTGFEGHEYFEAPSVRKYDGIYYLIYSSIKCHELCYATSTSPTGDFKYRGVIISNTDIGIDSYKDKDMPAFYGANNHGGIIRLSNSKEYIFYHRHTDGTNFSRQGCIEKISIEKDGTIKQVEMTSAGAAEKPFAGKGVYPVYFACNLFCDREQTYTGDPGTFLGPDFPRITQDGNDDPHDDGYITNMVSGTVCGFKYFDLKDLKSVAVWVRGFVNGDFSVRIGLDGRPLGKVHIEKENFWRRFEIPVDGITENDAALYFEYRGSGALQFLKFELG